MFKSKVHIKEIGDVPLDSGGSPNLSVFEEDFGHLWIAYNTTINDEVALICFKELYEHRIGYPNDEGIHPLCKYGLPTLGFCLIENSPRISQIIKEQKADTRKQSGWEKSYNHWVWRFKETTLEVIGKTYEVVGTFCVAKTSRDVLIEHLISQESKVALHHK